MFLIEKHQMDDEPFHDQFDDEVEQQPIQEQQSTLITPEHPPQNILRQQEPQQPQKKKIIICIPGDTFSKHFLLAWTEVITMFIIGNKYQIMVSTEYSSHMNLARAMCLGANVLGGPNQLPFQGCLDYDAIVWIDPDIVFNYDKLLSLIDTCINYYPVVSGVYPMENEKELCCVKEWDMEHYKQFGRFKYLTIEECEQLISSNIPCIKCAYVGMGCMAIRKGVIEDERFKYPWFFSDIKKIPTGNPNMPYLYDGTSEDVSFVRNLIESGVIDGILVNLKMRFGREKTVIY